MSENNAKYSLPLISSSASRRCFMSGEYCSKLSNIQKECQSLHEKNEINAFVIMNFSNMSDVAYRWRLKPFIESLKNFLRIDKQNNRLICYGNSKDANNEKIKQINVIRADTTYASNYVVCNRICQQIQVADLIIVDVSVENNNVFYEFGMAVAHDKLILPICYSESFYQIVYPAGVKAYHEFDAEKYRRHIDCYPWRRALFEYYGLRYRREKILSDNSEANKHNITQYLEFDDATQRSFGYSDKQYNRFPYLDNVPNKEKTVGKILYNRLKDSYNSSLYEHNTLVVYTMDGFLNADQAGQCMINYHKYMTH